MSLFAMVWRFLPLLILLLAWLLARSDQHELFASGLLIALPYVLACVLAAFAFMFNRSRFMAPVVIAVFTYHFIRERLQIPLHQDSVMAMFTSLNLLFCAQLLVAALVPEKGLFNRAGYLLIGCFLSGFLALWFYGQAQFWTTLLDSLPTQPSVFFENHYWMSQAIVFCLAITLAILTLATVLRRTVADYALMLTWLAGVLVFIDFSVVEVSSLCFSALFAGLFVFYQQSNYQVTFKDALTGISGRRALEDYLATLGRTYAIAMLDVDHFKKFNDTWGHDVGDQVLKMVAAKVSSVEGGGKAFRYGGEEFTIVFNRKRVDDAFVFLEAVRMSIQQYQMTLRSDDRVRDRKSGRQQRGKAKKPREQTVSVTISIGVANSQPGLSAKDVIGQADQLLYKAKEAGRNCTIRAD